MSQNGSNREDPAPKSNFQTAKRALKSFTNFAKLATPAGAHLFNTAKALRIHTAPDRSLRFLAYFGLFHT